MYQPRAYPPRQPQEADKAGYKVAHSNTKHNAGLTKSRHSLSTETVSKGERGSRVELVRSRPQSVSRSHSRSQSNPRTSSQAKMYSVEQSTAEGRVTPNVSLAHLQEMRERSKVLRDQVMGAQKSVQSKNEQLARLRNSRLPSEETRKEEATLVRLTDRINVQEARLKKLRDTKTKIQQQVIINGAMNTELEGLKNILTNKRKEIYDIDQVINQLITRLQQAKVDRNSRNVKNNQSSDRIEELKKEIQARNRMTENVQGKFSSQREALHGRKEEIAKMDLQISELWRKLQQAKASQQQSSQKPTAAVAAVEPFEHKPPSENTFPPTDMKLANKPQEIDIKLIERNGGSGQSSPSVSADEREPYSTRPVKPPPRVIPVDISGSHDPSKGSSRSSEGHLTTVGSSSPIVNGTDANLTHRFKPGSISSLSTGDGRQRSSSSSSSPSTANERLESPRESSPRHNSVDEMRLEKGPVHQFKSQSNIPESPSSVSKPKNFNAKPKPFSTASTFSQPSAKSSNATAKVNTTVMPASTKKEVGGTRELSMPYSRAYPPTPIMGRQQLNSSSQSGTSSASNNSPQLKRSSHKQPDETGPSSRGQTRYATRSQISDTYIPQMDKSRLDQYRRDMENAVRGVTRSDNSTVPMTTRTSPTDSTPNPLLGTTSPTSLVQSGSTLVSTDVSTPIVTSAGLQAAGIVTGQGVIPSIGTIAPIYNMVASTSIPTSSPSAVAPHPSVTFPQPTVSASRTSNSVIPPPLHTSSSQGGSRSIVSPHNISSSSLNTPNSVSSHYTTSNVALPTATTGSSVAVSTTVPSVLLETSEPATTSSSIPQPSTNVAHFDTNISFGEMDPSSFTSSILPPQRPYIANTGSQSLHVLAESESISKFSSDQLSSEDERQSDFVVIYNPADADGSLSHLMSIVKKRPKDTIDGAVSSKSHSRNARLHPLVILLDAALNGSVEEIVDILPEVENASEANDEGITALHNAICAGHMEIVRTLVEYGVDVNVVDLDGWTPLHCAASCNNQPVVEYLISKGASIISTTYSDQETPLEKCEVDEEGYDGTSQCLLDAEGRLGTNEPVYSVHSYQPENEDELSLRVNDKLCILRKGDEVESDWWWARSEQGIEGYVAKTFLALTPRVLPVA